MRSAERVVTPEVVLEFLYAIERGEIALVAEKCPQDVYAGNVGYVAANGWTVVVFNDCNEWDYVESIILSDGTRLCFWDYTDGEGKSLDINDPKAKLDPQWEQVRSYKPRPALRWIAYHIPGYLNWRCERCGRWKKSTDGDVFYMVVGNENLCCRCRGVERPADESLSVDPVVDAVFNSIREARSAVINDEAALIAEGILD